LAVGVSFGVSVGEGDGVAVLVGEGEGEGEGVMVLVGDGEGDGVAVLVGFSVGDRVGDPVAVSITIGAISPALLLRVHAKAPPAPPKRTSAAPTIAHSGMPNMRRRALAA
jgi:hypothetical protein